MATSDQVAEADHTVRPSPEFRRLTRVMHVLGQADPSPEQYAAECAAACRTVAGHARDAADLARLLDVLGIPLPGRPAPAPAAPDPGAHGTRRGYQRHLREGSEPCEACREANRRKAQRAVGTPGATRRLRPIVHGTTRGYRQHWYRNEAACAACLAAIREDWRRREAARRTRRAGGAA
ncbi:hypothetical protein FZ103_00125 [Streptomonospora sp. PA3]|uniref:hypothetical protein n=1 Tax=Streptomonospora sp. PA3 TaxID=2607326 RepID=UPI0012DBF7DB|nr:hypothetical protein [Streptomonospora sp. PA3]MUL39600.1 hypothetical protein [Streptomonospora sp. PA3]